MKFHLGLYTVLPNSTIRQQVYAHDFIAEGCSPPGNIHSCVKPSSDLAIDCKVFFKVISCKTAQTDATADLIKCKGDSLRAKRAKAHFCMKPLSRYCEFYASNFAARVISPFLSLSANPFSLGHTNGLRSMD